MKDSILSVQELSWKPNKEVSVLEEVGCEFHEGGFYGILGPNGSGKTSLIRHILRFLEAQTGKIELEKKELQQFTRKRLATYLSFVPQNVNMDLNFTAYDVVAMGRTPYLKRFQELSKKDYECIDQAMKIANCYELKDKMFSNLSGGESQRVLVARAIAQDTKWLILDEPISHLDIRYQVELMETLKRLNQQEGRTILAILHDLNLSAAYCKEILLMKDGKVFAQGEVDDVLTVANLKEVYEMEFEIHQRAQKQKYFIPIVQK